jgi:hypothetical protein
MYRAFCVLLLAIAWLDAPAQSALPPCPSDISVVWTNCFGTYTQSDGSRYVGEFDEDMYHGNGSLILSSGEKFVGRYLKGRRSGKGTSISSKGHVFVEGIWIDDFTVLVGSSLWRIASYALDGSNEYWVLSDSIRDDGAVRRVWVMATNAAPDPKDKALSSRLLVNFACIDERYSIVTASRFSGSFGSGDILSSYDGGKWDYVAPDTVFSFVMKYVCEYKTTLKK